MFATLLSRHRCARGRRSSRLAIEILEQRDCPSSSPLDTSPETEYIPPLPQLGLTLNTEVLPGHLVRLTGSVIGNFNVASVVSFSGAVSGSCGIDLLGNYEFTTQTASLGEVTAIGLLNLVPITETVTRTVATPAPTITLAVSGVTATTISYSGTLTGVDVANQLVTVSGNHPSVMTDELGNFSFTVPRSESGVISVSETDLWGQSSNVAELDETSIPPFITLEREFLESENRYRFFGRVYGFNLSTAVVTFSGITAGSAIVNTDGTYSFLSALTLESTGTVFANTTANNLQSNTAQVMV